MRWVSVAPAGSETEVILYLPDENWEHYQGVVGKSQALTFEVADMAALQVDLKDKGVNFIQEPDEQPWGIFAIIQDSEGNHLILVQQPAS
jgi:predicted enzyme related to lactoylglutathione lyase